MFGWVSNLFAKRRKRSNAAHNAQTLDRFRQFMRARVDAAQTTALNSNHWAMADSLSADAAYSLAVRKKVRERARYETLNNPRGRGIVQTYTTAIIGSGPRLQCVTDDEALNEAIETKWLLWARKVGLNDTLRTLRQAQTIDGEAFAVLVTGDNYSEITLDVRQIEADQCSDPSSAGQPYNMDGVEFNPSTGKPWRYTFLKQHPGDLNGRFTLQTDKVFASNVIHLFRADRPSQHRGLSEIASALDLFAILRRFTHATLTSAEAAAAFALFMKTNSSAVVPDQWDPWEEVEYRHGAAITLPEGWEPFQLKSEHPAAAYDMFVQTIVREIARCLDMPYNVAACDSAGYNYSSGRLDHQIFGRRIQVEQALLERQCLDRVFSAWLQEAVLAGVLPVQAVLADLSHTWAWDPLVDIDPQKTISTAVQALQFGLTSYPTIFGEQGQDWRTEMRKQAKALGMTFAAYQEALRNTLLGGGTPVPAASASEVEASKPTAAGEYADMSRLQWNRNMRAIRDVVEEIELGTMGDVMALEMLQSLKLPPERAQRLIDDAKTNRHRNPAVGGLAV